MENSLSIDECANELVKFTNMSLDEIKSMLVIMRNQDSNWIRPAMFVFRLYSRGNFATAQKLLTKTTGYSRAQVYNFKKAGERIFYRNLTEKDVQGITLVDFIRDKEYNKDGLINTILNIGSYKIGWAMNRVVYIYRACYEGNKIYFKTFDLELENNTTIEVKENLQNNSSNEKSKIFLYNGQEIELYNFEPYQKQNVNLQRKEW